MCFQRKCAIISSPMSQVLSIPKKNSFLSSCLSKSEREKGEKHLEFGHLRHSDSVKCNFFFKSSSQNAQTGETNIAHSATLDMQVISAACRSLQTPNTQKSIFVYKKSNQCCNLFFRSVCLYGPVLHNLSQSTHIIFFTSGGN